jgi:hypothetical protein
MTHEWEVKADGTKYSVVHHGEVIHTSHIYMDAVAYAESIPQIYTGSDGHGYTYALEGDGCDHEREAFGNGTIVDCRDQDACNTLFEIDENGVYVEMIAHCITTGSADRQARKLARTL